MNIIFVLHVFFSSKPPMACDMIAAVRLNTEDLNKKLKQMNEGKTNIY